MGELKLQMFGQEDIPAPVVWAEAYKGRNSDHYQQTMTYSSAFLNFLLLIIKIEKKKSSTQHHAFADYIHFLRLL